MVPLLGRGRLGILLLFALMLLLAATATTAGARFLGPLLLGPLIEARCFPSLQLQLLGLGLLVPVLAVDVVPPTALDALPQPLHHGAVLGNAAAAAPVSAAAAATAMSSAVTGRRAVGSVIHADTGPAEAAAQVIVEANAAAIRGSSGGWKIPHSLPRAHYFGRTFVFAPLYTRAPDTNTGSPPPSDGILFNGPWKEGTASPGKMFGVVWVEKENKKPLLVDPLRRRGGTILKRKKPRRWCCKVIARHNQQTQKESQQTDQRQFGSKLQGGEIRSVPF